MLVVKLENYSFKRRIIDPILGYILPVTNLYS